MLQNRYKILFESRNLQIFYSSHLICQNPMIQYVAKLDQQIPTFLSWYFFSLEEQMYKFKRFAIQARNVIWAICVDWVGETYNFRQW
jgi:hypothetical protein